MPEIQKKNQDIEVIKSLLVSFQNNPPGLLNTEEIERVKKMLSSLEVVKSLATGDTAYKYKQTKIGNKSVSRSLEVYYENGQLKIIKSVKKGDNIDGCLKVQKFAGTQSQVSYKQEITIDQFIQPKVELIMMRRLKKEWLDNNQHVQSKQGDSVGLVQFQYGEKLRSAVRYMGSESAHQCMNLYSEKASELIQDQMVIASAKVISKVIPQPEIETEIKSLNQTISQTISQIKPQSSSNSIDINLNERIAELWEMYGDLMKTHENQKFCFNDENTKKELKKLIKKMQGLIRRSKKVYCYSKLSTDSKERQQLNNAIKNSYLKNSYLGQDFLNKANRAATSKNLTRRQVDKLIVEVNIPYLIAQIIQLGNLGYRQHDMLCSHNVCLDDQGRLNIIDLEKKTDKIQTCSGSLRQMLWQLDNVTTARSDAKMNSYNQDLLSILSLCLYLEDAFGGNWPTNRQKIILKNVKSMKEKISADYKKNPPDIHRQVNLLQTLQGELKDGYFFGVKKVRKSRFTRAYNEEKVKVSDENVEKAGSYITMTGTENKTRRVVHFNSTSTLLNEAAKIAHKNSLGEQGGTANSDNKPNFPKKSSQ